MDRQTFIYQGKSYVDNSPPERASVYAQQLEQTLPFSGFTPDEAREVSFDADVDTATGDDDMATTAQEVETTKVKKAPAKTKAVPKSKGAQTSTKFSVYCKANKIDGVPARRALRAAGLRAPYDPASKKVLDVLATL